MQIQRENIFTEFLTGTQLPTNTCWKRIRSKVLFEARKVVKADRAKGAWSSDGNILIKDYGDVVHRLTSDDDLKDIDFPAKPEPPAPELMD